jgi:hypothetical protein
MLSSYTRKNEYSEVGLAEHTISVGLQEEIDVERITELPKSNRPGRFPLFFILQYMLYHISYSPAAPFVTASPFAITSRATLLLIAVEYKNRLTRPGTDTYHRPAVGLPEHEIFTDVNYRCGRESTARCEPLESPPYVLQDEIEARDDQQGDSGGE